MKANILSLLVKNRFGVLTKVTMLFGGRGCNIHSLTVDITHNPDLSRITVTVLESDEKVVQIFKQLKKLEDVKEVTLFRDSGFIEREVMLLRLRQGASEEALLAQNDEGLQIRRLENTNGKNIYEVMGESDRVTDLILRLGEEHIEKLSRSGRVALGV